MPNFHIAISHIPISGLPKNYIVSFETQHHIYYVWYFIYMTGLVVNYDISNAVLLERLYHKTSNIRHIKSPNFNVSRLVLQLSLPNPMKPRCQVENEDVVGAAPTGDAPTISEWSTILLPTKVRLILETWRFTTEPAIWPESDKWMLNLWNVDMKSCLMTLCHGNAYLITGPLWGESPQRGH